VLELPEPRHARLELLARDSARRAVELLSDPRERRRTAAVLLEQVRRRTVLSHVVDALEQACAAAEVDQRALVDDDCCAVAIVEGLETMQVDRCVCVGGGR
jgi:alcohol dehydrogenase class IV